MFNNMSLPWNMYHTVILVLHSQYKMAIYVVMVVMLREAYIMQWLTNFYQFLTSNGDTGLKFSICYVYTKSNTWYIP